MIFLFIFFSAEHFNKMKMKCFLVCVCVIENTLDVADIVQMLERVLK